MKYEEVYLKAYRDGSEARRGIDGYLDFYNRGRPHQSLGYRDSVPGVRVGKTAQVFTRAAVSLIIS